ncbi:hypothetical protein Aoki45_21840 [Algoriphagus sp. oki45]|uniref:RNA polymerase sigma factor n=1 Tax=Algoriphagus sp. oki45 TaxID=3067294 RepID=UPI0027F8547C|nr:hypothetical protein Aoki45_21840 [Algoriphagus sp. oki45]
MPKDSLNHLSQQELISGIRENDRRIMTLLYQDIFPKVRSYLLQNNGDEDQAKDIFQEAFLVVWQQVKSGDFQPQNSTALQGFLYQISKNKWLDFLRSSRFKKEQSLSGFPIERSDKQETGDQEEQLTLMEKAFSQLGENCQELLRKFYFEKISLPELAQNFGWTAQTAKNNKYRCMETLRKIMKP